jgi:hypothetical protein
MTHSNNADQESTTNDTKLSEFSPTTLNPQISRQDVMSVLQKMLSGSYINRNYFQSILKQSKDLLHSIDPVYDVEYPLTNGTSSADNPKVTVSSSFSLNLLYVYKYLQFHKKTNGDDKSVGSWRYSWTVSYSYAHISGQWIPLKE